MQLGNFTLVSLRNVVKLVAGGDVFVFGNDASARQRGFRMVGPDAVMGSVSTQGAVIGQNQEGLVHELDDLVSRLGKLVVDLERFESAVAPPEPLPAADAPVDTSTIQGRIGHAHYLANMASCTMSRLTRRVLGES
jgi:hypothetical protein